MNRRPYWLLTFPALVLVAFPTLALWVGAVGAAVAIVALLAVAYKLGAENVNLRGDLGAAEDDVADLTVQLTEAHIAAGRAIPLRPVSGGRLPMQRRGVHDHLKADDDWFSRLYDDKGDLR